VLRVLKLNELSSRREVNTRSELVCEPELGEHVDKVRLKDEDGEGCE